MDIKIIGAIGQIGSSKDEILRYFRTKHNIPFLSTGDVIREMAVKEGLEPTSENLGKSRGNVFVSWEKVAL